MSRKVHITILNDMFEFVKNTSSTYALNFMKCFYSPEKHSDILDFVKVESERLAAYDSVSSFAKLILKNTCLEH